MNILIREVVTEKGMIAEIIKAISLSEVAAMKPFGDEKHKEQKKEIIRFKKTS